MKNRRFRDEFQRHVETFGHDMEEASDKVRRGMARELRQLAPDVMRVGQAAAKDIWYRAEHIDQSLVRERKRPSTQPRVQPQVPVRQRMNTQRGY